MNSNRTYLVIRSVMGLAFHMMFTAAGLYRIDIANLEPYQLILLGTALEISVFVFEVPTGIIADLKSRKLSVIIGMFVIALGFILEALTPIFLVIFFAQIIWGFGYTFISGALDSWVSDEIEPRFMEHTIITGSQMNKLFSVLGIVLAAVIGMYDIRLAIHASGILFIILAIYSIIIMKENNFHIVKHKQPLYKEYFLQLVKGFKHIKTNKVLRIMFIIMLFFGLYSEGIDRTYELHILDGLNFRNIVDIAPIWILSIVNGVVAVFGYLLLFIVKKHLKNGKYIVIWLFNFIFMMILGVFMFAFMPNIYFALFGFIFFSISREGTYPLLNTILIKNTPSNIKATVLSGFGQLDAIGQLLSGGLMVLVSLMLGVKGVYIVTASLLFIPLILTPRLIKYTNNQTR